MLPDIIKPSLKIVFCGTAVGSASAQAGAYYADRGNKFWEILSRTGLTPRKFDPHEFRTLSEYGIGLTDLVKIRSGYDKAVSSLDFDIQSFCSKINQFIPKIIAFNGKKAVKEFFGHPVNYGGPLKDKSIGESMIFVLPSTSAAARRYWDERYWIELVNSI